MKVERLGSATDRVPTQAAAAAAADRTAGESEWSAPRLRPVAHWVVMPTERGDRLTMVWETPDPLPLS
ncbi:hypothetical protein ACIB24_04745 [Spongisporangium articulatum]|uniref:Uncharacterized protein n=1 Tax=Spongisporangium articulatum TaxID=3362603 RepID=A0ABW8AJ26_9ACTN